jgi:four helix bundle protein
MLKKFRAYQLAKEYYWLCKELKVQRILQYQLIRASSSVALNLSEASGRRTEADQRKHYAIAYGSLQECRTILELEKIEHLQLDNLGDQLAAILFTLSRKKIVTGQPLRGNQGSFCFHELRFRTAEQGAQGLHWMKPALSAGRQVAPDETEVLRTSLCSETA